MFRYKHIVLVVSIHNLPGQMAWNSSMHVTKESGILETMGMIQYADMWLICMYVYIYIHAYIPRKTNLHVFPCMRKLIREHTHSCAQCVLFGAVVSSDACSSGIHAPTYIWQ
jgi:hypothetical protein